MKPDKKPTEIIDLASWWSRSAAPVETGNLLRRATIVSRLKRALPLAGGIVLGIVLLWPLVKPQLPTPDWAKEVQGKGSELAMLDLTYRGVNDKGEPFSVTADKATRNVPLGMDAKKLDIAPMIGLTTPKAALQGTDGTVMNIEALNGQYDENAKGLNLTGDVIITNSDGMRLDASQMSVDFTQNRAWSDQPVNASGDFGTIAGEGMKLEDGGKTIIFTGKTRGLLNSSRSGKDEDKPAEMPSQPAPNQP